MAAQFKSGKIIKKVVCQHDAGQSYALYLPTGYGKEKDKKWPVLLAFEPAARVLLPLELFKPSVEKYGYIMVCPTNCKNGPTKPNVAAMQAVWADILIRFSIDRQRVYATGFSGGSRMSSFFHLAVNNPVRGIIGVGAGLSPNIDKKNFKINAYFGVVGFADFNYVEMVRLDKSFDEQGIAHNFVYFDSKHRWPPEDICTRAVEWLQLMAMKNGLIPKDDALVKTLMDQERKLAEKEEKNAGGYYATAQYENMAQTVKDLVPDEEIRSLIEKASGLKETKAYKKFEKKEQERLKREPEYIGKFAGMFHFLKNQNPSGIPSSRLINQLEIKRLVQEVKKKKNIYDAGQAERLLYNLTDKASQEGRGYMSKGDYNRAEIFLDIALAAGKFSWFYSNTLYDLTCLYALQNKTAKSVKMLKKAVANGFQAVNHMEKDKDLESIRGNPEYKAIIQQLKENRKN